MDPLAFMGLVLVGWGLLRRRNGSMLADRLARIAPPRAMVPWCCGGLVVLFGAQIALLTIRAEIDMPHLWQDALPYRLLDMGPYLRDPSDLLNSGLAFIIAIAESLCLGVVALGYARFPERSIKRAVWIAASAMALIALFAPVLTEKDIFEYLQCGSLGFGCYTADGRALFSGPLGYVSEHVKLYTSLYGPLWVALNTAVAQIPAGSLYARVEILRVYSALVVGAVTWLLWRIDIPQSARVAVLLCPFVWLYFVASAHIDMQAFLFVAAAFYCALKQWRLLTGILVGCAGLIKLPFVLLGGAVFLGWRRVSQRFIYWAIGGVVAAGGTYIAGRAYWNALQGFGHIGTPMSPKHLAIATVLQVITVLITIVMVATGRAYLGMLWLYPTGISPTGLPWYLSYSLPSGLVLGNEFTVFLALLPVSSILLDRHDLYFLSQILASVVCGMLIVDSRASWKRRTHAAEGGADAAR